MADGEAAPRKHYVAGREGTPGQGHFMILVLEVSRDRIIDARFQTYPCPVAAACGEFVANWLVGKTLAEAAALDADLIEGSIGKMPLGREHCPVLAVKALRDALERGSAAESAAC